MVDHDHMEVGHVIPMEDGWFMDKETRVKFRFDDEGHPIDEQGTLLMPLHEHMADEDD